MSSIESETMKTELSNEANEDHSYTLVAKFGKECHELAGLPACTTIREIKEVIQDRTNILPKRQKLVGLVAVNGGARGVTDELTLDQLKVKGKPSGVSNVTIHHFILMGTPEEAIFVDPSERDDLPDVVDDFELEFNAGSVEWLSHVSTGENLKKFTAETEIHIMNEPRKGYPLLVLDLDHTLLDFSSRVLQQSADDDAANFMKRPYMDTFLTQCYPHYDIVIWSQTSWRWLETKLIELGMLTHTGYRFSFVLDKTSMFTITNPDPHKGQRREHHVKPLQIIWSKFPQWSSANTVHIDDLSRNFALNRSSGLRCKAYYRRKRARDSELLGIGKYLVQLAKSRANFDNADFGKWQDVVQGKYPLLSTTKEADEDGDQKPPAT